MTNLRQKTYDPRCYDLANLFLQDDPKSTIEDRHELAAHIQSTIEDWIEDLQAQRSAALGRGFPKGQQG